MEVTLGIDLDSMYTHAKNKKATFSFVYGLFNLHSNSGVTYRPAQ